MRDETTRTKFIERLRQDLVGPAQEDEELSDWASDRYLSGILFPQRTDFGGDQDDDAETVSGQPQAGADTENIRSSSSFRPSSAGLSFAVAPGADGIAGLAVTVDAARYIEIDSTRNIETGTKGTSIEQSRRLETVTPETVARTDFNQPKWRRIPLRAYMEEIVESGPLRSIPLEPFGIYGMSLHLRVTSWEEKLLVTATLTNDADLTESESRKDAEEATFFQVGLSVSPLLGAKICRKPSLSLDHARDADSKSAALIYRNAAEYAVGHTCSAVWDSDNGIVGTVRTEWIPEAKVKASKSSGDMIFSVLSENPQESPLNARWLSEATGDSLTAGLSRLSALYSNWIDNRTQEIADLPPELEDQGKEHMRICANAQSRIEAGIRLLEHDETARAAFQLANRAIWLQNSWKAGRDPRLAPDLVWRPFQLAFVLLTLCSSSDSDDTDRETMDLLWFPTGGGKTEAYLLLTAYVIFLRRLRAKGEIAGAGVSVFMRYTLRLLTVQQFQRAAAMICACDLIRDGSVSAGAATLPAHFATGKPISIGLWVGEASAPNTVAKAIEALDSGSDSTPAQLSFCPVCNGKLAWSSPEGKDRIEVRCHAVGCDLGRRPGPLPVWTVDEDIYRVLPSLMIGTADKYAQLPRNGDTGRLFGLGVKRLPPDLIIQDELHLISGPLGTLAGIYEIAVDELCSRDGIRPKVIGSTATIRRADEQIRALFDRSAFQFPPPGLDHGNSGFATLDETDPGRIYVGVTTVGRSAKFTLQAVAASLLQSAAGPDLPERDRDAYWTLVAYFNSLHQLGGALVLMRDDVEKSIGEYASRRKESARDVAQQIELTSRVSSAEIPTMLDQLDKKADQDDCVDVVLASNMISVGVDVSRLGLMVVNGQPKGIAEYIQATSRVGRSNVPGLIVTVFNALKARDRSRYEGFANWHQSLYRDVEATSVTPFSPRARDRALHAAFVSIVRHIVPGMQGEPVDAGPYESDIRDVIDRIVARAESVDKEEANAVRRALEYHLDLWISKGKLKRYWDDYGDNGLLMSAETAAERAAGLKRKRNGWPTPNSLRTVEPSTAFVLRSGLRAREEDR